MSIAIDRSHKSPNHSSRGGHAIKMIVLHATVGSFTDSLNWLMNPISRVSSHYLLDKAGHIYQLVADDRVAWHAGASAWHGLDSDAIALCSLGIELENANDGHDPYPPLQLRVCHDLCQSLISRYNIERADVVRHLDIAIPKGRKTDPAGFPWALFADSLYMDSQPPQLPRDRHYKVKATVSSAAIVRAEARKDGAILTRLHAGEDWYGIPVEGMATTVKGFGTSKVWIRSTDHKFVWAGLLEEVKEP